MKVMNGKRTGKRLAQQMAMLLCIVGVTTACAVVPTTSSRQPQEAARASSGQPVEPQVAERLRRIMIPLIRAMKNPIPLNRVQVGIIDDPSINAASGGGGQFYVTTGLLQKANDEQLTGVLAHEVAHDDLGHVAKQQALGAGLNIATVLLEGVFPGSDRFTPIAGQLLARAYSRSEEYEADKHGVELLRRINMPKEVMINTLKWLMEASGPGGAGFFSTHPGTADRIEALEKMR
jgi:Zn-dependent protease with chaperone function